MPSGGNVGGAGVPEDRVTCDYGGFRTLDSVVRAKGIDAVGFNACDVAGRDSLRTRLRQHLARVAALLGM